jgi:hypothetical protein
VGGPVYALLVTPPPKTQAAMLVLRRQIATTQDVVIGHDVML